ncbi:hypothetical protein [Algoriphagus marinus]|uniref:hypothetical protein n=1 Tax=Algoriphagus marinus TaxID=1925762 RepID=UPI00094BAC7D|nr:hypothetical protein [Algoriphagus marinus]
MRFILFILVVIGVVVFLNPFFPFWVIMIVIALLSALLGLSGIQGFLAGGLGYGLAWLGQALFISATTGSDLPNRMAELMGIGSGMTIAGLTAIVGFFLGSFSGLTGSLLRNLFRKKPDNLYRG